MTLVEGSTDIGGTRTSIAMQLAETLGIAAEDVRPQVGRHRPRRLHVVTGGSRVTFATGLAAYKLGLDLQRADEASGPPRSGSASRPRCRSRTASISHNGQSLDVQGAGRRRSPSTSRRAGRRPGLASPRKARPTASASHIVDVEVDPETGKVTILRYTAVQDAGKAIHPSYVEGQMQGGAVQGIGWALNEEYFFDDQGRMRNASFLDYRMPTCLDVPMIDTIIVEVPNPAHPYGVRGVGETPIVAAPRRDRQRHLPRHRRAHDASCRCRRRRSGRRSRERPEPRGSAHAGRSSSPTQWRDLTGGVAGWPSRGRPSARWSTPSNSGSPASSGASAGAMPSRRASRSAIDDVMTPRGLRVALRPASEVHFLPAIGGG